MNHLFGAGFIVITGITFLSFKSLADTFTCPILGPLVPLFCISGDISGFQSQIGSILFALWRQMYCKFPEIHL